MYLVLTLILLREVVDFGLASPMIPQSSLQDVINQRRQLNDLKNFLQVLDDDFEKLDLTVSQSSLRDVFNKLEELNDLKSFLEDLDDTKKLEILSCLIDIKGTECGNRDITRITNDKIGWNGKLIPGKRNVLPITPAPLP